MLNKSKNPTNPSLTLVWRLLLSHLLRDYKTFCANLREVRDPQQEFMSYLDDYKCHRAEISNCISEGESHPCFLEEGNKRQQSNSPAQATEVKTLQQQLDDVENQEQQNNWCFIGFPEDNKNGDALSSVSKTLLRILNIDFLRGLDFDRDTRILVNLRLQDPSSTGFWNSGTTSQFQNCCTQDR